MDYTDEAGKAHNARNFVLYGHYIVDEFNEPIFSYPCYTIFLSLFFKNLRRAPRYRPVVFNPLLLHNVLADIPYHAAGEVREYGDLVCRPVLLDFVVLSVS